MADNEENKEPEVHKTIDELAREAMEAIKASEARQERIQEDEIKRKEESLKLEVQERIKAKMRKLKNAESKKPKIQEVDTRYMVSWKNVAPNISYEGEYNKKLAFKIKRGINLFHLYVMDNDMITEEWRKKGHTSISLDGLKEKADKILKESIERRKKAKKDGK